MCLCFVCFFFTNSNPLLIVILCYSTNNFELNSFLFIEVLFKQMIYFPKSVFTTILSYADDRIERNQRNGLRKCLKTISRLRDGWYYNHILYMEQTIDWRDLPNLTNVEHIDYYMEENNKFQNIGMPPEELEEINNDRMDDFKNRINGGLFMPIF